MTKGENKGPPCPDGSFDKPLTNMKVFSKSTIKIICINKLNNRLTCAVQIQVLTLVYFAKAWKAVAIEETQSVNYCNCM